MVAIQLKFRANDCVGRLAEFRLAPPPPRYAAAEGRMVRQSATGLFWGAKSKLVYDVQSCSQFTTNQTLPRFLFLQDDALPVAELTVSRHR